MKWVASDIEKYVKSIEYVDTAVIPLLPISFGDDIKESAAMTEFTTLLTNLLERQLQGRILLIPGFSYLREEKNEALDQLNRWESQLLDNQFNHVFHVTSDMDWKQDEEHLRGTLLWLPSIPLQHMDERSKTSVMEDQVRQLMNLFIQKWREEE
ncbi:YpiF family protein [Bacillus sp. B15-48]|uniref:YpiF family protein n=1 Tax=Bacillus sp. B15-48 TaxID=1548601 RepID=UPI00193EE8C7|nr:YpiF family protein [Bacillus sp. B15-48]MBM4762114.1 DUF2487 family protein [Bacillus sp. B15-48]